MRFRIYDTLIGSKVFNCPYSSDYVISFISVLYVIKDDLWRDYSSLEVGTAYKHVT